MSVVQDLVVAADELKALEKAISILMHHHSKVAGFRVFEGVDDEPPILALCWHAGEKNITPLLTPMASAETVAAMVCDWLVAVKDQYGREPDTDGSTSRGWRIETRRPPRLGYEYMGYVTAFITPEWIVYGK